MRGTTSLDKEIGRRLRQARLAENLTQDGLAKKLGISFQQVQKYENGSNRVSASRLFSVAKVLNLPITYFYDEIEGPGSAASATAEDSALPDRVIRVARVLSEIPDGAIKDQLFQLVKVVGRTG